MRSAFVSVALLVSLSAGCNDPTAGPLAKQEVGEYGLQTVNRSALPYLSTQNGVFKAEITSGSLELRNDLSFAESRISRITQGAVITPLEAMTSGTYVKNGTQIVFTIPSSPNTLAITYQGVLSTNAVTITSPEGTIFGYARR